MVWLLQKALRGRLIKDVEALQGMVASDEIKAACTNFLETKDSSTLNAPATKELIAAIEALMLTVITNTRKYFRKQKVLS